jgi:hypothetical protein
MQRDGTAHGLRAEISGGGIAMPASSKEKAVMNNATRTARVENLRTFLVAVTAGITACLAVAAIQLAWLYFESWVFRASGLQNYIMFALPQGAAALGISVVWIGYGRAKFWWILVGLAILLLWIAWFFLPFELGLISPAFRHH